MDLREFNMKRNTIDLCYKKIVQISKDLKDETIIDTIEESTRNLKEDSFNLVVVGEFSRGKSTFINALLGKRVLPSSTKPTTTIINKISFAEEPKINLHFRNSDDVKVITEKVFKDITAKIEPDFDDEFEMKEYKENLKLVTSIAYADIKYPTEICKEGIEIVDTPGTNDLDQAREEITFKFIPKSDVAILLLSANQILSQSEMSFLKERILENDIRKVFFIINFKDRLSGKEDEEKVIGYAKEHLNKIIDDPRIYLVSAKGALNYKRKQNGELFKGSVPETLEETGFIEMEREITAYLMNERASIKLNKYVVRGVKLIGQIMNTIDVKLKTVNLSAKELEKKLNALTPQFKKIRQESRVIIDEMKSKLKSLGVDFANRYREGLELIASQANLTVNRYDGNLDVESISREIESVVAPLQKKLQKELEDYKIEYIDKEVNIAIRRLEKIWNDMSFELANTLEIITKEEAEEVAIIKSKENEGYSYENILPIMAVSGISSLLGSPLLFYVTAPITVPVVVISVAVFAGKYILDSIFPGRKRNEFITEIKEQVDKRFGEIIPKQIKTFENNYRENIDLVVKPIEKQVFSRIEGLEMNLQNLIDEKKEKDIKAEEQTLRLTNYKKELDLIKRRLEEV